MTTYRTGGHWGRTIVRVGQQSADDTGRRPDDELVGLMDDPALAERIAWLLTAADAADSSSVADASTQYRFIQSGEMQLIIGHLPDCGCDLSTPDPEATLVQLGCVQGYLPNRELRQ